LLHNFDEDMTHRPPPAWTGEHFNIIIIIIIIIITGTPGAGVQLFLRSAPVCPSEKAMFCI